MQFVKDPTSDVILFTIYGLYIVLSNFNVKNRIKREWRERERERELSEFSCNFHCSSIRIGRIFYVI